MIAVSVGRVVSSSWFSMVVVWAVWRVVSRESFWSVWRQRWWKVGSFWGVRRIRVGFGVAWVVVVAAVVVLFIVFVVVVGVAGWGCGWLGAGSGGAVSSSYPSPRPSTSPSPSLTPTTPEDTAKSTIGVKKDEEEADMFNMLTLFCLVSSSATFRTKETEKSMA